jgi:glutaredoxin
MKSKAIFYHAGCPVCVEAEQSVANALDKQDYDIEIVHLADQQSRIEEAESAGVKSVPALLLGEKVFHINFGAALTDIK